MRKSEQDQVRKIENTLISKYLFIRNRKWDITTDPTDKNRIIKNIITSFINKFNNLDEINKFLENSLYKTDIKNTENKNSPYLAFLKCKIHNHKENLQSRWFYY